MQGELSPLFTLGSLFESYRSNCSQNICATFLTVKSYVFIVTKMDWAIFWVIGLYFGRFFRKLIWSPLTNFVLHSYGVPLPA
jgi:hypothetical protein